MFFCFAVGMVLVVCKDKIIFGAVVVCPPDPPFPGVSCPPEFPYDSTYSFPILMYHQIDTPSGGLTVTPDDFALQMDTLLESGFTTVSMDAISLAMAGEPVPLPPKAVVLTFDDGYSCFYRNAFQILKERNLTATIFIITGLVGKPGYMAWDQIAELAAEGFTVGCHTHSHPDLRTLPVGGFAKEIHQSRECLQKATGQAVLSFSYPSGKYDDRVVDMVVQAGFLGAVTVNSGAEDLAGQPLTLRRVRVDGRDSVHVFKTKLAIP